jgi:hypothetical protein
LVAVGERGEGGHGLVGEGANADALKVAAQVVLCVEVDAKG